jgi:hypothetical protein
MKMLACVHTTIHMLPELTLDILVPVGYPSAVYIWVILLKFFFDGLPLCHTYSRAGSSLLTMLSTFLIAIGALLATSVTGQVSGQTSPPKYPSPWLTGNFDWEDPSPVPTNGRTWQAAYDMAIDFVSQLTLLEKVNLTTGVGWEGGRCVGNTGSIPRLGFPGLCMQDSPLGVRDSEINWWHDYVAKH